MGQLLDIKSTMEVPVALSGHLIIGIKLEGAAKSLQGQLGSAAARIAAAAKYVREDAHRRQQPAGVPEIKHKRHDEPHDLGLEQITEEDSQAKSQCGAKGADLDLCLLFPPGKSQYIEEQNANQQ